MRTNPRKPTGIQLALAVVLSVFGMLMLTVGFAAPPIGEIHPSLLAGFGEIATFAGALMGIDYHYKFRYHISEKEKKEGTNDNIEQRD